jgi:hypothetical protein
MSQIKRPNSSLNLETILKWDVIIKREPMFVLNKIFIGTVITERSKLVDYSTSTTKYSRLLYYSNVTESRNPQLYVKVE